MIHTSLRVARFLLVILLGLSTAFGEQPPPAPTPTDIAIIQAAAKSAADSATQAEAAARAAQAAAGAVASRLQIEVAATGGFAGLPTLDLHTTTHFICTGTGSSQCSTDPNNVDLVKTNSVSWKPAVSAGLVFRWLLRSNVPQSQAADTLGIGVGAHFVFVPSGGNNSTSAAPAITMHIGTAKMQVFCGVLFATSQDATLPGGGNLATVPAGFNVSSVVPFNSGRAPSWFAGIVLGGKTVSTPTPAPQN